MTQYLLACSLIIATAAIPMMAEAQRPEREVRTAGTIPMLDSLKTRGIVALQSPNYGVELSSGLTAQFLAHGIPVYLDPVRVLQGNALVITGGDDTQYLQQTRADSYGFAPPATAYGLIVDMATDLPGVFDNRAQTRVYIVDRGSGQILRFITADGRRDDGDAERLFARLMDP